MIDKIRAAWKKMTPARRRKLYRIAAMIAAILTAQGIVKADSLMDWVQVIGYAMGVVTPTVADKFLSD